MLWAPLTESGERVETADLANRVVDFASMAMGEVSTVLNTDRFGSEISVDLAVTMSPPEGLDDVLLVPRGDYYAGGGGASGRSGVGYEGGRGTDLGFGVTKYSLFGSDQCASISGAVLSFENVLGYQDSAGLPSTDQNTTLHCSPTRFFFSLCLPAF